jgi:ABC-type branched-subunit amino acid transport system substrate-binding protein
MLKRLAAIGAIAGSVAAIVAVTLGGTAAAAAAKTSPLCKTAGLGYAGPLSGPASFLGQDQLHWMQLFISDWNARKAIPGVPKTLKRVKLKDANNGDSMLQAGPAATVARSMVANKSILGMVGFAGSNENLGGGPVLDRAKLAYVSGSATLDNLTRQLKNFYRVVPNNTQQATAGVSYIVKTLGLKSGDKVMVVDDGEAYGIGIADAAGKLLSAKGISIDREQVPESTSTTTADFHTVAQKAVTLNAKLVYAPTQTASDSETFAQLLKSDGYKGAFMATDGSVDPSHFNFPGAYISFFGPNVSAINAAFLSKFKAKYGASAASDPFGAPSFVAAEMLGVAISQSCAAGHGKTSRAAVAAKLASVKLPATILGYPLAFNNGGDVRRGPATGVTVFKIQSNGTYTQVFPNG